MIEINPCPECGIPDFIPGEQQWLNNGDMVQKREQWHRMIFIESENIDPLFKGIEQIIGASMENIIITAVRRAVVLYLSLFIPEAIRELVQKRRIPLRPLSKATADMARMMGLGNYQYVDLHYEMSIDDYYTVSVTEPFSIPMIVATHAAGVEVMTGQIGRAHV